MILGAQPTAQFCLTFARLVRGSGLAIVSGFHSPIEKDCLRNRFVASAAARQSPC